MNSVFYRCFRRHYFGMLYTKSLLNGEKYVKQTLQPFSLVSNNVYDVYKPNLQVVRKKYSEKKHSEETSDSDSDDDKDFDDGVRDRNAKVVTVKVGSLRTDLIIKAGLSVARNKVENLYYERRIRVNGKKIPKKSMQIHIGDEVDVVRGLSPVNPDFLLVSRIEVLSMKPGEENISVTVRRFKSLVIENYSSDPWKEAIIDS